VSQVFQSLEFQGRERHGLTLAARFHGRKTHLHITEQRHRFAEKSGEFRRCLVFVKGCASRDL
jgi:hypothetical protein